MYHVRFSAKARKDKLGNESHSAAHRSHSLLLPQQGDNVKVIFHQPSFFGWVGCPVCHSRAPPGRFSRAIESTKTPSCPVPSWQRGNPDLGMRKGDCSMKIPPRRVRGSSRKLTLYNLTYKSRPSVATLILLTKRELSYKVGLVHA